MKQQALLHYPGSISLGFLRITTLRTRYFSPPQEMLVVAGSDQLFWAGKTTS